MDKNERHDLRASLAVIQTACEALRPIVTDEATKWLAMIILHAGKCLDVIDLREEGL